MGKRTELVFCTLIGALLLGTLLFGVILPDRQSSEMENRVLQQFPVLSLKTITSGDFMSEFECYVADQFPGRDVFVSLKAQLEQWQGKKENDGVYFAKDGYLIEKLPTVEWRAVNNSLAALEDLASLREFSVFALIAPTAAETLRDELPAYAYDDSQAQLLDTIEKTLTDVTCTDVRATLAQNRDHLLYYRTDHHWTTYAAYLAYCQLGESLGYTPIPVEDFTVDPVTTQFYGTTWSKAPIANQQADTIEVWHHPLQEHITIAFADQATMSGLYDDSYLCTKDKYSVFLSGTQSSLTITNLDAPDRTLVVLRDSYANCLIPFLTAHYRTIEVLDLRYYNRDVLSFLRQSGAQQVLFCYNAATFSTDRNVAKAGLID